MKSRKYEKPNGHYSISQKLCGTDQNFSLFGHLFSPRITVALFNEQFHYYIFAQSVFLKQARVEKKKRCLLSTFKISIEDHVLTGFNSLQ